MSIYYYFEFYYTILSTITSEFAFLSLEEVYLQAMKFHTLRILPTNDAKRHFLTWFTPIYFKSFARLQVFKNFLNA